MKTLSYAFKYLLKLRGNNVIKLISITMGLFLGWVFLAKIVYVESYNKSFPDAERIYRVDERVTLPDREIRAGYISAPVAPALKDEFPEIETATVICRHFPLLTHGEHPFEINIACTDTAFFDLFSIEVLSGDPDIPLLRRSNLPEAVVEAVDPIVLDARIVESGCCRRECDCDLCEVPPAISQCFGGELCGGDDGRRIYITLGQFSIVRLERDSQLLVPVYDYCMPEKECSCGNTDDPCSLFRNISFPVGEFFPPNTVSLPENYEEAKNFCACCHK